MLCASVNGWDQYRWHLSREKGVRWLQFGPHPPGRDNDAQQEGQQVSGGGVHPARQLEQCISVVRLDGRVGPLVGGGDSDACYGQPGFVGRWVAERVTSKSLLTWPFFSVSILLRPTKIAVVLGRFF